MSSWFGSNISKAQFKPIERTKTPTQRARPKNTPDAPHPRTRYPPFYGLMVPNPRKDIVCAYGHSQFSYLHEQQILEAPVVIGVCEFVGNTVYEIVRERGDDAKNARSSALAEMAVLSRTVNEGANVWDTINRLAVHFQMPP